jgi:hypothetical protein
MTLSKLFTLILFVGSFSLNARITSAGNLPDNSIVIKAGGANDVNAFFSTTKAVAFSIYKATDLVGTVKKLQEAAGVDNVIQEKVAGDYILINVSIKDVKDKAYWSALFVSAGFKKIKINNADPVDVDKL